MLVWKFAKIILGPKVKEGQRIKVHNYRGAPTKVMKKKHNDDLLDLLDSQEDTSKKKKKVRKVKKKLKTKKSKNSKNLNFICNLTCSYRCWCIRSQNAEGTFSTTNSFKNYGF